MIDKFSSALWELGKDSPEVQQIIANSMTGDTGYFIPTGDFIESLPSSIKDKVIKNLQPTLSMTVEEIATRLSIIRAELTELEEQGTELAPAQKTLKDLDIITLAWTIQHIRLKPKAFDTAEEFEEALAQARERAQHKDI